MTWYVPDAGGHGEATGADSGDAHHPRPATRRARSTESRKTGHIGPAETERDAREKGKQINN